MDTCKLIVVLSIITVYSITSPFISHAILENNGEKCLCVVKNQPMKINIYDYVYVYLMLFISLMLDSLYLVYHFGRMNRAKYFENFFFLSMGIVIVFNIAWILVGIITIVNLEKSCFEDCNTIVDGHIIFFIMMLIPILSAIFGLQVSFRHSLYHPIDTDIIDHDDV